MTIRKINNFLDTTFGIRVSRSTNSKIIKKSIQNNQKIPLYIEFTGASGVGKSTLFKELYNKEKWNREWLTPDEFIRIETAKINNRLYNKTYENIIERKMEAIHRMEVSPSDKMNLVSFFNKNIKKEIITYHFNQNQTIINEDGLLHNFGKHVCQLLEQNRISAHILENRAIVYCLSSPETIVKQIRKRDKEKNAIRPQHKNKTQKQLEQQQKRVLKRKENQVELFKKMDVPILKINTEESIDKNAQKVSKFIHEVQKQK